MHKLFVRFSGNGVKGKAADRSDLIPFFLSFTYWFYHSKLLYYSITYWWTWFHSWTSFTWSDCSFPSNTVNWESILALALIFLRHSLFCYCELWEGSDCELFFHYSWTNRCFFYSFSLWSYLLNQMELKEEGQAILRSLLLLLEL